MFTGIVEEIGEVTKVIKSRSSFKISVKANKVLEGTKIGDSVCTNGVCLTVCNIEDSIFTVDIMDETLKKSSLREIKIGNKVNLERAVVVNGRLDGHIVTGHIDGTGSILKIDHKTNGIWVYVSCKNNILEGIVDKGSITIDGVSLTIAYLDNTSFAVSLIPHTYKNTLFSLKKVGDIVNLECDIIGKYVYKFFLNKSNKKSNLINENFLIENGFM